MSTTLSAVVDRIKSDERKDHAKQLETYRELVKKLASSKPLTDKETRTVTELLTTFRLTTDNLTADVAAFQQFTELAEAVTGIDAKVKAAEDERTKALEEGQELHRQLLILQQTADVAGYKIKDMVQTVNAHRRMLNANPRLFATMWTPAPPGPPETSPKFTGMASPPTGARAAVRLTPEDIKEAEALAAR